MLKRTTHEQSEMEARADRVSLVYVSDNEPGLTRRVAGKGFTFLDARGRRVADKATLERIARIAIPPAWTGVWICADEDGHIQATGRDQRGRKQYRYHERWANCRDEVKYGSLVAFAEALPRLRVAVDADLRRRSLTFERVAAAVVWLLDNTMIRVGNPAYARDNKSFGLTTLRSRHVEVEGSALRFAFKGKSGKEWKIRLVDRRMARIVRTIQDLPGQHLFQYIDEDGVPRQIRSHDVNDYIRQATGAAFSSKHFRTWGGTVHAATLLADVPVPETKPARARFLNEAIDAVAGRLGNTRTVCRTCYIHPAVVSSWEQGVLGDQLQAARRSFRKIPDGLDEEEVTVMRWLAARSA